MTQRELSIAMVAACPFPANRGTPSRILGMSQALRDRGHRVHVATYHFGIELPIDGIAIHRTPRLPYRRFAPGPTLCKLGLLDPLLFFTLLKLVRKQKIDIIHAHHFEGALVAYLVRTLTGIKVIYDAHTTLESELGSYRFPNLRFLADYLDRGIPRWADHIVAVSETLSDAYQTAGVEQETIDIVPTGVDPRDFEVPETEILKTEHELRQLARGDKQVVMYTGSLATFQGIDLLLRAMQRVFIRKRNVVLVLVVTSDTAALRQRCVELGLHENVVIREEPTFKEVPRHLACADVVVNPRTDCSGTPQKLSNYMAARRAIVSFEGSAKLLTHGRNALVVENGNVNAMADAIVALLEDEELRRQLGDDAQSVLCNNYAWDSLSARLEDIYYRLLGSPVEPQVPLESVAAGR